MVSPLQAWGVTLIASVLTAFIWLVSAPIVSALYSATSGLLPEEAEGAAYMMRVQFIIFPIIICSLLVVWSFIVTTRRQPVVRGEWA